MLGGKLPKLRVLECSAYDDLTEIQYPHVEILSIIGTASYDAYAGALSAAACFCVPFPSVREIRIRQRYDFFVFFDAIFQRADVLFPQLELVTTEYSNHMTGRKWKFEKCVEMDMELQPRINNNADLIGNLFKYHRRGMIKLNLGWGSD